MDDEIIREFLVESHEGLDRLDRDFIALETSPNDSERIAEVFRTIHTIKGSAGFLGFDGLEALAHSGESLLSKLRDGTLPLTTEMMRALLRVVDRVREIMTVVEATGREPETPHGDLIRELERIGAEPMVPRAVAQAQLDQMMLAEPPGEVAEIAEVVPQQTAPVVTPPSAVAETAPTPQQDTIAVADSYVRIDVDLLDKLMNLVGELVLARNQIVQVGARLEDGTFQGAAQRLDLVTTELQEHVMKTRMQPIGNVWGKLPRVVRDLAVSCGKQVRVEMIGKETELDRTIIEAIKDPLTHIVRNSVDHGIETPATRAAAGKPKTGTLTLRAYHEGGQVNIEITDDGGGLDLDAVRRKAIDRRIVTAERAATMGERELAQLVFQPGFSTAASVTNVSGRGVGMDVVLTNIERIGGTVDIISTRGKGTTIKIKIPLTLAIVPALLIGSGSERYAIPQANLVELLRVESAAIEMIQGVPVYRLRGQLLPLVDLAHVLGATHSNRFDPTALDRPLSIIVLAADDRQFGLVVDEIRDTEEIVVKPLGKELKAVPLYAGATIMGDGRIALILDVLGLCEWAGISAHERSPVAADAGGESHAAEHKEALLLFAVRPNATMAVPLALVARLEEISRASIERAGNGNVVQYRGRILPLVDLRENGDDGTDAMPVIVYSQGDRNVGFVVGKILDVVEEHVRVEPTMRRGVAGSAIVQGRATELLDVRGVIRDQVPGFFDGEAQ